MVTTGPVADPYALPSGLVMHRGLVIPEDEVQELKDRIQAAGGWCAPSEVIYLDDPPPAISPTGFIPDMDDIMTLDERRHEIFARWDEEDAWLQEQMDLARVKAPPEWVEWSGLIL